MIRLDEATAVWAVGAMSVSSDPSRAMNVR